MESPDDLRELPAQRRVIKLDLNAFSEEFCLALTGMSNPQTFQIFVIWPYTLESITATSASRSFPMICSGV
jgi:hypothetical protein